MRLGNSTRCVLSTALLVLLAPAVLRADLVAHWTMDGFIEDEVNGLAGQYFEIGTETPGTFVEGYDGTFDGAVSFDAAFLNVILIEDNAILPIYNNPAYSVAMWVKGPSMQQDERVFSESSNSDRSPLFNIGTHFQGADGRVDIFIRDDGGETGNIVGHTLSTREAFDDTWHHIAWVDDNGQAVLYIDGVRDETDFSYTRQDINVNATTIGGILRNELLDDLCCQFTGAIDDVRLYDHALSEEEVREIVLGDEECPVDGDTHCGTLEVLGPGDNTPGTYTFTVNDAVDDSGDPILYSFEAIGDGGQNLTSGPSASNSASFDLGDGEWAIIATVDDQPLCDDEAADNTCETELVIGCPTVGDTHCNFISVIAPEDGGPGIVSVIVSDATDDSGDPISYTFTADNGVDPPQVVGPQAIDFADFTLGEGTWELSVTVDDSAECDDAAPDNTCVEELILACPAEGDTHVDDVIIDGPDGNTPGTYTVEVLGAGDDSGDLIFYTYRAEKGDESIVIGPTLELFSAAFTLGPGDWTISVTVDDDPNCGDVADDATFTQQLTVEPIAPSLIARWTFDETLEDATGNGNDGIFLEGLAESNPFYVDGFDGTPLGAVDFDGLDDLVSAEQTFGLPIYAHGAYTVAMWVNGPPPGETGTRDLRVFSEGSTLSNTPLLNIGTSSRTDTGEVDIFIRDNNGANNGHPISQREAFDNTWHHIAWVDDNGLASLYIDGVRDAGFFEYDLGPLSLNTTTIGGILRAAPSHWNRALIDDVRVYNYALSETEIQEVVGQSDDCPEDGDTHCGSLEIVGPAGNLPGDYTLTAVGATDDSGDSILYTFTATDENGSVRQMGPGPDGTVVMNLLPGMWTIEVTVDDQLECFDRAADASCSQELEVVFPEPRVVAYFPFDGTLEDATGNGNDGAFLTGSPTYVEGVEGDAVEFDGVDDVVVVTQNDGLPLTQGLEFSVAMWVRGDGTSPDNTDDRIFSEGTDVDNNPLFNLGTDNTAASPAFDLFVRNGGTVVGHRKSQLSPFDGQWRHVAFTMAFDGTGTLYVDGEQDPVDFSYPRQMWNHTTTTIGGILRAATCCLFTGTIDEVYLTNYVLEPCEVRELMGETDACGGDQPQFRRGDVDGSGVVDISDPIANLTNQFLGGPIPCRDAADYNDSGAVDISDPIANLTNQFLGGPPAAPPGSETCGPDPTPDAGADGDDLGCENPPTNC